MAKTLQSQVDRMVVLKLRSPSKLVTAEFASAAARRALLAEFLGTMIFVVFGAGTVAVTAGLLGERLTSARLLVVALAQGIAYPLLVLATLGASGGHLNPAVTLAQMITRQMTVTKGVFYVVFQCAGAVAGALLLRLMIPSPAQGGLGAHGLAPRVTIMGGLVTEALLTFALVYAVLSATRGIAHQAPLGLLAVGLTATVAYLFGTPLTGGSMNPARSFGPALVAGVWKDHWILWLGPLAGGAIAAVVAQTFGRNSR